MQIGGEASQSNSRMHFSFSLRRIMFIPIKGILHVILTTFFKVFAAATNKYFMRCGFSYRTKDQILQL